MNVEIASRIELPSFNVERLSSGILIVRSKNFDISLGATNAPHRFSEMERDMILLNGKLPIKRAKIGNNLLIFTSRGIDLQINDGGELQTQQSRSFAYGSIVSYWGESPSVNGEPKLYGQYARRFTESSRDHMHPKAEHYIWASGEAMIKIGRDPMYYLNESNPYQQVPPFTSHQIKTVGHESIALIICEDPRHIY